MQSLGWGCAGGCLGLRQQPPELPLEPQAEMEGGWAIEGVNCYSSCRGLSGDITIMLCCTC